MTTSPAPTARPCFACDHQHDPASAGDCATARCLLTCTACGTVRPLVVFSALGYCDTVAGHEHRLITDGERAYAYSATIGDAAPAVFRDGTLVSIDCTQPDRRDPSTDCYGRIEWRLDEPRTWTADADARDLLAAHGKPVER